MNDYADDNSIIYILTSRAARIFYNNMSLEEYENDDHFLYYIYYRSINNT